MKDKRGQLAIFIIIGVVLLIISGGIMFLVSKNKIPSEEKLDLSSIDDIQLNAFITSCIEEVAYDGINTLGYRDNALEQYMNLNVQRCTNNFDDFKEQGFEVNVTTINSSVYISDKTVAVYINYPIELKGERFHFIADLYNVIISRDTIYTLDVDSSGKMRSTQIIRSPDGRMELIIPANTRVDAREISIRMRNNDYDKDEFGIMIPIIYEFSDTSFSPPATLVYNYDKKILPSLTDEESLRISYYDESSKKMVDLQGDVDLIHNKITSQIYHFTDVTLTTDCSCLDKEQAEKELELEKPKTIFDLSDEDCIQETENLEVCCKISTITDEGVVDEYVWKEESQCYLPEEVVDTTMNVVDNQLCGQEELECNADDPDACISLHPSCEEEGGMGWSSCVDDICKYGCQCVEGEEECNEGYECVDGECVVGEPNEESQDEGQDDEQEEIHITTCEEAQIIKTENEDGSVNYKFRMKPSDCGEDGVCYLAFVVIDEDKIIQEYIPPSLTQ